MTLSRMAPPIVIPAYQPDATLLDLVRCLEQPVIVVDDGSTDLTRSVAQKYGRIHYIYQPNQGVSAARNAGIRQSRGTYITFLDADDRLLPDALAAGIDCFRKFQSCGFVVGRYRKIASDGSPISGPNRPSGPIQ